MADGGPESPPRQLIKMSTTEYLFYCSGMRRGHSEAVKGQADNAARLVEWFDSGEASLALAREKFAEHERDARAHSKSASSDADLLLDQAEAARAKRPTIFARIAAAWRALLGS